MSTLDMIVFIGAMTLATMITRFAPFLIPERWTRNRFVRIAKNFLPPAILLLLVVYSLKDTAFDKAPHGLAEALSLALVLVVHLWKANALLSILLGTACYMLLTQTGLLKSLFL
jgi:branched-subunit amino acid transport protein AzlD